MSISFRQAKAGLNQHAYIHTPETAGATVTNGVRYKHIFETVGRSGSQ